MLMLLSFSIFTWTELHVLFLVAEKKLFSNRTESIAQFLNLDSFLVPE